VAFLLCLLAHSGEDHIREPSGCQIRALLSWTVRPTLECSAAYNGCRASMLEAGLMRRYFLPLAAATFAAALLGVAQTSHGSHLIKVSNCDPRLNLRQSGSFPRFYTPVVWRGRWVDPYGRRYYEPPVSTTNPELGIHYTNISDRPMTSIEFGLVAKGNLVAEVRDVGTFSPGAEIRHRFGISENVFPIGTGLPQCVPLRIAFADGTMWTNPRLPPR
jgi:hypothetical protein